MNYAGPDESSAPLTALQLSLARHRLYSLLRRLYLHGLVSDLLGTVRTIPELSNTVAVPFDADEAAATHHGVFGFHLFPYESAFLSTTGLLGGEVSERVQHSYYAAGFALPETGESPDHIGCELAFLAFLCGAEADAWHGSLESDARRTQQLQQDFLERHLLRWLAPCVLALHSHIDPFYSALATLTLEFVADHYANLSELDASPTFNLPIPPPLLHDSTTGVREISDFLLTPAYSGIFITKGDLVQLARRHHIPRGFGSRSQILANMLRAAATYDVLQPLSDDISEFANRRHNEYIRHMTSFPAISGFIIPWRLRTLATIELLSALDRMMMSPPKGTPS